MVNLIKRKRKPKIFLDSGGFSAWACNVEIDINKYIKFIKDYSDYIYVYANLDVIGNPEASWKNQEKMEKEGLKPLPIYHLEDGFDYLHKCMEYDYFCIGGMARGATELQKIKFLDNCWDIIQEEQDRMDVWFKVHGFGLTGVKLMLRYPWFSVDSTTWVLTSRFGMIFVPRQSFGKNDYTKQPMKVSVSKRSPAKCEFGKHIEYFGEEETKIIMNYIKKKGYKLGKSKFKKVNPDYVLQKNEIWTKENISYEGLEQQENKEAGNFSEVEVIIEKGLCNNYRMRDKLNIQFFIDFEKKSPKWPRRYEKKHIKPLF